MTSFSVQAGTADTTAKTVSGNDTGRVGTAATLSAATAITWTGGSANPGTVLTNAGAISATTRAIDTSGNFTTGSLSIVNQAGGRIVASSNDAVRVNAAIVNGTVSIDNAGLLVSGAVDQAGAVVARSSGQAIDLAAIVSPNAVITITNRAGATIGASGDDAIRPGAGHVTLTNSGLIDATASGRGINLNAGTLASISEFHLFNTSGATIQSRGDTVRVTAATLSTTATGTFTIENAGTIVSLGTGSSNGQAVDFTDLVSPLASVTITNLASGLLQAADADAVRGGVNTTINNFGRILAFNGTPTSTGNDGIDFQSNAGGTLHNGDAANTGALVDGARHGVTGDKPVTIDNWGTIVGRAGAGVNLDTAATTTTRITNHGTITGTAVSSDGDGVDVDGLVTIENFGTIQATGRSVIDPTTGAVALQEALTIGGGTITNRQGGLITSFERAITVDDSNEGNAPAATTILNEGTIRGGNGQAISIVDTFADTLTNKGVIEGSVALGGGDDTINLYTGSRISGVVDGGTGTDMAHLYGTGTADLPALVNVEALDVAGGTWSLTADEVFSSGVAITAGAALRVAVGTLTANVADEGALVFAHADAIVFAGTVSGSGTLRQDGTGTLALSGHNTYTGGTTIAAGTLDLATADAAGTGAIHFGDGAQTLRLEAGSFSNGHLANTLSGFVGGDAIEVAGLSTPTGATLDAGHLLTVTDNSGVSVTLQIDLLDDVSGKIFKVGPDGVGGTRITVADAVEVGSGYHIGSTGDDTVVMAGNGSLYAASAGNDYIVMGSGTGGSANGGTGDDRIFGGAAKDVITGGTGTDYVVGGGGADTFIFAKGDLSDVGSHGGGYDVIADFEGAGDGYVSGSGDFIRFQGFTAAATLTHVGEVVGHAEQHIYQVDDGAYHAQLVINYAGGAGADLRLGDYAFAA